MIDLNIIREGGRREVLRGIEFSPGFPGRCEDVQEIAATHSNRALINGASPGAALLSRVRFVALQAAGVGESMTLNVFYSGPSGGVQLLAADFVYDETTPPGVYEPALAAGLGELEPGGFFLSFRTYVAGGGPAMQRTAIVLDYYGDPLP